MTARRRPLSVTPLAIVALAWAAACSDAGCSDRGDSDVRTPGPSAPAEAATDPAPDTWFVEAAAERGLDFVHDSGHDGERFLMPEAVCGGGALLDADGDGDLDAYLVQGGSLLGGESPPNRLYANDGRGYFQDVTEASGAGDRGYGMGVAVGDVDGDGALDLYVTNLGRNTFLRGSGGGVFADETERSGTGDERFGASAGFLDFDLDGQLDLFVVNYVNWYLTAELDCRDMMGLPDYCGPLNYEAPSRDVLYRGLGDGRFEDVSASSGVASERGTGLGIGCGDFDGDGLPDIFVANDGMPDCLWRNGGDGTFENVALAAGCALDHEGSAKAGMGVAVADVDDDADLDLIVCNRNRESDSFFRNEGGRFRDAASTAGLRIVSRPFTRFGMGWIDFDDDGRLDLYQANGRVERQSVPYSADPLAEPNLVLRGLADGSFEEVEPRGGTRELLSLTSRAAAFGDVDGDGGMDVLVVNKDAPAMLLLNRVPDRGAWVELQVLGANGADAIGATVSAEVEGRRLYRDVRSAYSYLSASALTVHLGLGGQEAAREVRVRFPDGHVEAYGDLEAGRRHTLRRGAGRPLAD